MKFQRQQMVKTRYSGRYTGEIPLFRSLPHSIKSGLIHKHQVQSFAATRWAELRKRTGLGNQIQPCPGKPIKPCSSVRTAHYQINVESGTRMTVGGHSVPPYDKRFQSGLLLAEPDVIGKVHAQHFSFCRQKSN